MVVQWLRLHAASAGRLGLIPGQGARIPHAATKTWHSQINKNTKKKKSETVVL